MNIKELIKQLEETGKIKHKEFASYRVDDTLPKEAQIEEMEEEMAETENQDPQDTDENRIWECGYLEGYQQAIRDVKKLIKEN